MAIALAHDEHFFAEVDTMKVRLLLLFVFMLSVEGDIHLTVDWSSSFRTTTTAAAVEVDVMPQLARTQNQSGFGGYMRALQQLGASYVRFAPWFGYPRVVVPEWSQTNCSGAGSSWNSTLLDGVVADFMTAVCGPHAAAGECADGLSVAPQLSTMPMWLYQPDGINRTRDFPESTPWQYVPGHLSHFAAHGILVLIFCLILVLIFCLINHISAPLSLPATLQEHRYVTLLARTWQRMQLATWGGTQQAASLTSVACGMTQVSTTTGRFSQYSTKTSTTHPRAVAVRGTMLSSCWR